MNITRIDHLVLTVKEIRRTIAFYVNILGMREVSVGGGRTALQFGHHMIKLHEYQNELEPKALHPTPGSADLCLIAGTPLSEVVEHLTALAVPIVEGPIRRAGATGPITSVYIRDPDYNLIEISNYE